MKTGGMIGVVMVALAANLAMTIASGIATVWTGSSAMLAIAILALVATLNQGLLLLGVHRARQPADALHPFGYARELYFWGFVVAVLLFSLAAGVAIHEGVEAVVTPRPVTSPAVAYAVLAAAAGLAGLAMARAISERNRRSGGGQAVPALRASRNPSLFVVLTECAAAFAGLAVAAIGIAVSHLVGWPAADGYAAILIGLLLGAVAASMSIEVRSLIVGEAASPAARRDIHETIVAEVGPGRPIRAVNEIRTMQLGPRDILVAASVDFEDSAPAAAVEAAVARIEQTIRARIPAVRRIFIEGQSARDHASAEQVMANRSPRDPAPATAARQPGLTSPATLLSASHATPAPAEPAKRLSRKERKRQKHLKRR